MTDIAMEPLWSRVLLEREKFASKTSSIIIPENAAQRNAPARGRILAAGETCEDNIKAMVGRTVIFGRNAGDWLKDGDREVFICDEQDLLCVLPEGS